MKNIAIIWISVQAATITSNKDGDQIVKLTGTIVDLRDRSDLDFMLDVSNSKIGKLALDVFLDNGEGGTLPEVAVPVNLVGNVNIDKKTKLTTIRLSCTRDALTERGLTADMLMDAGLRLDCRFEQVKENEDQGTLFDGEAGTVELDPSSEIPGTVEETQPEADPETTDQDSTPAEDNTPEVEPVAETAPTQDAAPELPAKPARKSRITSKGGEA